jgi:cellulose synthase/poly-beta-1,6-N-acetylglucosamine synthase-like glycosyltransferase
MIVGGYGFVVLLYFALLNLAYAGLGYKGLKTVRDYRQGRSSLALRDALAQGSYRPVSILVPARDEEDAIVASVYSYLALDYPDFEIIVVSDGSVDLTLPRLADSFDLYEVPGIYQKRIETAPVRAVYRSARYPRLIVVDKDYGGKSDALNAGLNLARYPLLCAVDADSLLDAGALLTVSGHFAEDERLIAAGGTIRPLERAVQAAGGGETRLPRSWLTRVQVVEYARALLMDRLGWSGSNHLLIISGAFGVFSRDAVMKVGGYRIGTVGEDMELVVRLHKHFLDQGLDYKMLFVPELICWTATPRGLGNLRRQRNRWQRGLWEALWLHRDMLFNRRYGRLGTVVLPYFWFFEGLAPVVEGVGYVLIILSLLLGFMFPEFALIFLFLTVFCGMILSQLAVGVETLLFGRYPRLGDRLALFGAILLELFGYRQLLVIERFAATFQVFSRRGHWGRRRPRRSDY